MQAFQVRQIGTQEIQIDTTVEDMDSLLHNKGKIFQLASISGNKRPDGLWEVRLTLKPDNGFLVDEQS